MEQPQTQEEVLIARNNETGQVGAVVGQNPDGTPQMADAKSAKMSDLVKFSKGQNPLEAFMSNFLRQAKNPSLFGLFKVPAEQFDTVGKVTVDLAQDAEANKELLTPYKVKPEEYATKHTQEQGQPEAQKPKAPSQKPTPVDETKINWQEIEQQWGISKSQLEESGALKAMLYNHKSPNLIKIAPTFDGQRYEAEAKLSFRQNSDGSVSLTPHFIRSKPQLEKEYRGYNFSDEDKAVLTKTGNLGKVVDLTNPKTGEKEKCLVSIDKVTNEIESIPVDRVYIRSKLANLDLSMKEIGILKNGGTLKEKNIELPNGKKFTADLQYNVGKREVTFNSEPYRKQETKQEVERKPNWLDESGNIKRLSQWCKIPLNEQQQADYMAGKKVLVGNGKDKFGNDCTIYFQFDPKSGRPETERVYPDREKVVGLDKAVKQAKEQVADSMKTQVQKPEADPAKKKVKTQKL